jgi:hypothetical protein
MKMIPAFPVLVLVTCSSVTEEKQMSNAVLSVSQGFCEDGVVHRQKPAHTARCAVLNDHVVIYSPSMGTSSEPRQQARI